MKEKTGILNFKGLRIEKRLMKAFGLVSIIAAFATLVGLAAIIIVTANFKYAMGNYALPQGDIALFMNEYAECRSNTRGIIGYDDPDLIQDLLNKHEERKKTTYERLADIEKTIVTPEGHAAYTGIENALEKYFEVETEVIKLGSSPNQADVDKAQHMAIEKLAGVYRDLDNATVHLMDINIEKEHELEIMCMVLEYCAMGLMVLFTVFIIVFSRIFSSVIAKGISQPLKDLGTRLNAFGKGDISSPFPVYNEDDEIGDMIQEFNGTTGKLQSILGDMESLLNDMAGGNFNVISSCRDAYVGEFEGLLTAMREMNYKVDGALKDVRDASENVSTGSANMAEGGQALAEGAAEQTVAVEKMQYTMESLTKGLEKCAENMTEAYDKAQECAKAAEDSRVEMDGMVATMERISDTSSKIEGIIGEIEEIASQTNLLSLNAAIEAARAGEAGRGFAVVADQIRNLAEQSAKSAVNTRQLIEGSVYEVGVGTKAALKTAQVLNEVVGSVQNIADVSQVLNEELTVQVSSVEEAMDGIVKISEIVQENSATAQEASATSQELAAQAINMENLVAKFQLRDE